MALEVSEDLIRAVTTKDKALSDGRSLSKKGAFKNTFRTDDSSLMWGECQGSGAKPYILSIDLAGDAPTIRCSCPVKPPPCKHTLGLLVHFMDQQAKFKVGEAPAELAEKRAKNLDRAEKRAETTAKPKAENLAAAKKKSEAQRKAIDDLLEPLLVDAVKNGVGTIDKKRAAKLVEQARQLNDAYLPGAAERLRRIAALAAPEKDDDEDTYYQLREPGDDLPDERRYRLMARHVTRLWAMVRKGRKYLDDKLEEGESQDDADAVVEELLGRVWKLDELKAKGHARQNLQLLELAYERFDDHVRGERIEQSWLLDLEEGSIHVDRTFRPLDRMDKMKEGESYEKPLVIAEAAVYPGFVNKRIRWEIGARRSRSPELADFTRIHERAIGLDAAVQKLKEQLKNPLAPDDAVLLVKTEDLRKTKSGLVLVDPQGKKLSLADSPLARYRSLGNAEMAAGAALDGGKLKGPAATLVRLYLGLDDDAIHGQPLALVIGNQHVRVGM